MSKENLVAKAETIIDASPEKIWKALTDPAIIKQYMFGSEVISNWKEGSTITWKGKWQGKDYADHGEILEVIPDSHLKYSHFSPLSGLEDIPSNYHTVTIDLDEIGKQTRLTLVQDKNETEEQKQHSEKNWGMMLESLKKILEKNIY